MKILHVITSLQTGGAEHLMVDLLPRLRDKGNEVDLCVFNGVRTSFYDQLETEGIRVIPLSKSGSVYNPALIFKLRRLMRGYDIVHTHNTAPQFFAAIAKRRGVRLMTTEHSTSNRRRRYRIFRYIDKWMYGRYDRIICISYIAEKSLRSYIGDDYPILTIQNGVDVHRFMDAAPVDIGLSGCKVTTMVAAFRYEKDQPTVIRAMKHLPEEYHLVLVGDGGRRTEFEGVVDELGLQNRVHLLGIRTDVPAILKASDVVVMSSHREGLSLSNVEGMASGHPFVASDVDGLREVTGGYGVLFPHGEDKALAEIIMKLCEDKEYAAEVASRCRERALQYDIEKMVEGYENLYRES